MHYLVFTTSRHLVDAALHCSIISLYDLKTKLLDKCSFTTFAQCNINPIFLTPILALSLAGVDRSSTYVKANNLTSQ